MLIHLQRLAHRLRPARRVITGLGVLFFAATAYLVLFADPGAGEDWLPALVLGLVWCLVANLFIATFEDLPPPAQRSAPLWRRIKRGAARFWYRLLALALVGLTGAALLLSLRLLREALG